MITSRTFDVCEAFLALEWDWNAGGILWERPSCARRRESIAVQLHRMQFKPSPLFNGYESLTEQGKEIYHYWAERWGLK